MRTFLIMLIGFFCIIGCTDHEAEREGKKLSTRERDSILAESPLPGANVVGKAISVSDSLGARAKRLDSQAADIDNERNELE